MISLTLPNKSHDKDRMRLQFKQLPQPRRMGESLQLYYNTSSFEDFSLVGGSHFFLGEPHFNSYGTNTFPISGQLLIGTIFILQAEVSLQHGLQHL